MSKKNLPAPFKSSADMALVPLGPKQTTTEMQEMRIQQSRLKPPNIVNIVATASLISEDHHGYRLDLRKIA